MTSQNPLQTRREATAATVRSLRAVKSIVDHGPAPVEHTGPAAAGPRPESDRWPDWARPQLARAFAVAGMVPRGASVAAVLYRDWFNPQVGVDLWRPRRPLVGVYRTAHAGSGRRITDDGVQVVSRHDIIGVDGWWRTWGERWTPPRTRPGSIRVLMTPHPDRMAALVSTITTIMSATEIPWSLACATSPRRLRRYASAVLDVPSPDVVPDDLFRELAPVLRPVTPPLCLPIAPGVAVAYHADNGMTFGEHRCHLIALALRRSRTEESAFDAVARVFTAHGIDPAEPYRAG